MENSNLDKQFIGQARLARLLLWRFGDSTDIEECLPAAKEIGKLDDSEISFLRECLDAEEASRNDGSLSIDIEKDTVLRLRRCADKLNRADCG